MTNDTTLKVAPQVQTDPPKTLTLDVTRYQAMLDDTGVTDAEKTELLEALWAIIVAFVDLGWGVAPEDSCGKHARKTSEAHRAHGPLIQSTHTKSETGGEA